MYISAEKADTNGIAKVLEDALSDGHIEANDIVWQGPSGDYFVAASPAGLDGDYAEYSDGGTVTEFIHEEGEAHS